MGELAELSTRDALVEERTLECPICSNTSEVLTVTTCGHSFCEDCLQRWLSDHSSCPICRRGLPRGGYTVIYTPERGRVVYMHGAETLNYQVKCRWRTIEGACDGLYLQQLSIRTGETRPACCTLCRGSILVPSRGCPHIVEWLKRESYIVSDEEIVPDHYFNPGPLTSPLESLPSSQERDVAWLCLVLGVVACFVIVITASIVVFSIVLCVMDSFCAHYPLLRCFSACWSYGVSRIEPGSMRDLELQPPGCIEEVTRGTYS